MKAFARTLCVLLLALPAFAGVIPYPVQTEKLPNGLKVVMIPMPSDGLVSYWSIVRTGSRDEVEPGVTGFAHFFEHMMFRGSKKYTADQYERMSQAMGANSNAFTSNDITAYHLTFTKPDLATVIDIESARFMGLEYAEAEFRTEAGAVYGEYRKGRTNPMWVLDEAVNEAAFDQHTYKHTTIGFEADIKNMPQQYQYSKSFWQRFYRPENVVILVTGDFDPADTLKKIRAAYGDWKPGYVAPKVPVEPEQKAARRIDIPFDGQTLPILALNWKGDGLKPTDRKMMAGMLLGELAVGSTTEIYKKLVLDEQRVQGLGAGFSPSRDPSLWSIYAWVMDPADVAAIEAEIRAAVAKLSRERVSTERLNEVRDTMRYRFQSGLDTPEAVASELAFYVALTGGVEAVDEMDATMAAVTPDDVLAAAKTYLTDARCTTATLHSKDQPIPTPKPTADPVLMPQPLDPNVTVKLWFKVGSQDDPGGKEGLARLTAQMITEAGSSRRPYDQILRDVEAMAGSIGVNVDKEMTVVTAHVHRDLAARLSDLIAEMVVGPGFRTEDFDRLKNEALTALEKQLRYSSDEELGKALLTNQVFQGTRYAHPILGTVAGLNSITLDDVRAFWKANFTRDNVTVGIAGAYGEPFRDRLYADVGRLPAGRPAPASAPKPATIAGRRVAIAVKPGPATAISFGYPIDLKRGEREFYALWIANSWLGEHRNSVSHLYNVIREQRGLNYGDYSYIEAFPGGGFRDMPPTGVGRKKQMFEVWIRPVAHENATFALRAAMREIDQLVKNGMDRDAFERHRTFLKKYSSHFAPDAGVRLGYALDDRFYGLDGHLAKFRKMMDEITLDEVNAAVRKYLSTKNVQIAMVTADGKALADRLVAGKPEKPAYQGVTKSAEILAEDDAIAAYPLALERSAITIIPVEELFAK